MRTATIGMRRREGDVGVDRKPARAQIDRIVLAAAADRRAFGLRPADGLLLVGERRAVPRLDEHADAARDEV
jgi:hypothetical protein